MRISSNQKGMTLLEVIVSIGILSFITYGIASITQNAGTVKDTTVSEDREMLQVEKAFYRFGYDFEQIYSPLFHSNVYTIPPVERGKELKEEELEARQVQRNLIDHYGSQEDFNLINQQGLIVPKIYQEGKETFAFYTASNRRKYQNARESRYAWVLYTLEDKTITDDFGEEYKSKSLVRYYSASNPFEAPIWKKTADLKSQIVLPNVVSLKFSFWNPDQEKYVEDLKVIKGGENLIRGVKVELTWVDQYEVERSTVRFFKPAWDIFKPETDEEITKLQTALRQYGKKIEGPNNSGDRDDN